MAAGDQKGAPAKAHRHLISCTKGDHLADLIGANEVGRAQHRHWISALEVRQRRNQPYRCADVDRTCRVIHQQPGSGFGTLAAAGWWLTLVSAAADLRTIAIWSGALAGLMLILAGGLITAAVPWPSASDPLSLLPLPMTLQVPALLLTALVCGPRSAMLAAIAYLSLGLFQLPVFQGGGGLGYVLDPGFGYLVGFVPAAWLTGRLARQEGMDDLLRLFGISLLGVAVLQLVGLLNLLLGAVAGRWPQLLPQLLISYGLGPLVTQVLLCCAVAVLAWLLRRGLKLNP